MNLKFWQILVSDFRAHQSNRGFILPMTIGLGFAITILALTAAMLVLVDRSITVDRRKNMTSLMVAEGATDRLLILLSQRNNTILLGRNYDPINPATGKNYLGADGQPNTGDEVNVALDQWTGYNPSSSPCFQQAGVGTPNLPLTGTMGNSAYKLIAYRYNPQRQLGTLLVESSLDGHSSVVAISLKLAVDSMNFPGLVIQYPYMNGAHGEGRMILRGRSILGQNGNVYYPSKTSADPSLTGSSAPGSSNRASYLNAIHSNITEDGATGDSVSGTISACTLNPSWAITAQGTNLGDITTSSTLTGTAGVVTYYQVDTINLTHNDMLTVDTTAGPVYLFINGNAVPDSYVANLRGNSKIVNVRTDGRPSRVGDLRIIVLGHAHIGLFDRSCIQNAFIYSPFDTLGLFTTDGGCTNNSNFVGVAWVEALKSSKNAVTNRDVNYPDGDPLLNTIITPGATSGIIIPDDVSSLNDLLMYIDWPARYRIQGVASWQQVRL